MAEVADRPTKGRGGFLGRAGHLGLAAGAALALLLALLVRLVDRATLFEGFLQLSFSLMIPSLIWFLFGDWFTRQLESRRHAGKGASGPLGELASRVRAFADVIILPIIASLSWFLLKRALARAGPQVNASLEAINVARDTVKSVALLGLVPLVSMVTAAHEARDHERLLGLAGLGLLIGVAAGLVAQAVMLLGGSRLLGMFEGNEALLPEAPRLLQIYGSTLGLAVFSAVEAAFLAGMAEHLLVGECLFPGVVSQLLTFSLFSVDTDLRWLALGNSFNDVLVTLTLTVNLWGTLTEVLAAKTSGGGGGEPPAAAPGPWIRRLAPPRRLLAEMLPSREVLHDLLSATANSGLRNLALRLQMFLCRMYATRLGNVQGSTFALQQNLTAFLAGPAGFSGLFTASGAPLLLQAKHFRVFIKGLKVVLCALIVGASVWLLAAARGGPRRMLYLVGVTGEARQGGLASEEEYLLVLTPLNHAMWAAATVANELAAPFDGVLITLGSFRAMGVLYALIFSGVLLPALSAVHFLRSPDACAVTGAEGGAWGCNGFTGVMLAMLLWALARLAGMMYLVFGCRVPEMQSRQRGFAEACQPEVVKGYLRARSRLPQEEIDAVKAELHSKKNFIERDLYKYRASSPLGRWAEEHGTSMEAMADKLEELRAGGDPAFMADLGRYWALWGDFL